MRRFLCALTMVFLAGAGPAAAQWLTLHEPVDLRARPGAKPPVVVAAPAGAELYIYEIGGKWIPVYFEGQRFYAPAVQLAAAAPSDQPGPDPTCDYGYPYSGSGLYFTARPLTQLRHSEPFGFLLGYHRFYPC